MDSEFKRGYTLGVEDNDELNGLGLADCFKCGKLLAFLGVIVGVSKPVKVWPVWGVGSPTVLAGPATEFGLFSLPGTELGSCGMREGV